MGTTEKKGPWNNIIWTSILSWYKLHFSFLSAIDLLLHWLCDTFFRPLYIWKVIVLHLGYLHILNARGNLCPLGKCKDRGWGEEHHKNVLGGRLVSLHYGLTWSLLKEFDIISRIAKPNTSKLLLLGSFQHWHFEHMSGNVLNVVTYCSHNPSRSLELFNVQNVLCN